MSDETHQIPYLVPSCRPPAFRVLLTYAGTHCRSEIIHPPIVTANVFYTLLVASISDLPQILPGR